MKKYTAFLVAAAALLAVHCGLAEPAAPSTEADVIMTSEEELALASCLAGLGVTDGGLPDLKKIEALVKACLADAGFPGIPSPPKLDAGIPKPPAFDAGLPPIPAFDAGLPPIPAFDAGAPPVPSFDAGTSALFPPCQAGCACPSGKKCMNAFQATCPAKFAVCM